MRSSIKAKQVAGVTSIVGLAVVVLSGLYLSSLARVTLEESRARAELLANAVYHRAREVVAQSPDPYAALRADDGMRSILESSAYSRNVTFAAIVDTSGAAIAHSDSTDVGRTLPQLPDLSALLDQGAFAQLQAIYSHNGRTYEVRRPLLRGDAEFGSIRIGLSMLLTRDEIDKALRPALLTALGALAVASFVAMMLAQVLLRPIHVLRSGLTRLGRGESGVVVDLPQNDEFGELGGFFNTVSARLSADRTQLAGQKANFESIVENLEDAVAVLTPDAAFVFANPAMRETLPPEPLSRKVEEILPVGHPYRRLIEESLVTGQSRGPVSVRIPGGGAPVGGDESAGERMILTNVIKNLDGRVVSIMLVVRNLEYLGQVKSTLNYSRKLAALGRLSAGVAHEIKNPLNATMIHLELLKQQLSRGAVTRPGEAAPKGPSVDLNAAMGHVSVIAGEMRRLDEVVQGFLKFTRPEDLKLQPASLKLLLDDLMPVIAAEATERHVEVKIECPPDLATIRGDMSMLQQAFLNLALNALQAMPNGGRLRIAGSNAPGSRVEVVFEDTGAGIAPEHLERIFDLYFTTKERGSGIGLSMVYRTVQLHDGDIEVESVPDRGTTFRVMLPRA